MSRLVTIERREAGVEERALFGFRVKDTCPRDTLSIAVKYRVFLFDNDGNPVHANFKRPMAIEGMTVIADYKKQQPWHDHSHVYTFQKRYRDEHTKGKPMIPGARFESMPVSVALSIAKAYGHVVEVKEIDPGIDEAKRYEAFIRAELVEVPDDLPMVDVVRPAEVNPLALEKPRAQLGQDRRRANEPEEIEPQVGEGRDSGRVTIEENEGLSDYNITDVEKDLKEDGPDSEIVVDGTPEEDEEKTEPEAPEAEEPEPEDPNLPDED